MRTALSLMAVRVFRRTYEVSDTHSTKSRMFTPRSYICVILDFEAYPLLFACVFRENGALRRARTSKARSKAPGESLEKELFAAEFPRRAFSAVLIRSNTRKVFLCGILRNSKANKGERRLPCPLPPPRRYGGEPNALPRRRYRAPPPKPSA